MKVFKNYSLSGKNSLRLESSCAVYIDLFTKNDVLALLTLPEFDKSNFFILGEGSNVILPQFFKGTVLHPNFLGIECDDKASNKQLVKVGAGESWANLIAYTLEKELRGLENLTLIPGSVGAAPIQNIGAYGVEVCECIHSVEVFNFESDIFEVLSADQCEFAYRDSLFKCKPSTYLIISVNFILKKTADLQYAYAALKNRLVEEGISEQSLSQAQLSNLVASIRRERLPNPNDLPNAGSFFKNPVVSAAAFTSLKNRFPEIVSFSQTDNSVKLSAAWLIDHCAWKGRSEGDLMVSEQHALVLINKGQSNQTALLAFAKRIQEDVFNKFSVSLEIEPVLK